MPELLRVTELDVRYRVASALMARLGGYEPTIQAVADVSLEIAPGSGFGLVGESGSGKSTLGRAIVGLLPIASGRIELAGAQLPTGRAPRAWHRAAAMTFQDPIGSLSPRLRVGALIGEPLRIHGTGGPAPGERVAELAGLVGLDRALLDRYPHELSGGQARRVGIARALAVEPRLLVADEPTAGLDVSVQGDVLNLLGRLRREFGLGLLLITHNLAAARFGTDHVGVMYLGRLVEVRTTAALFAAPAHPYTSALLAAMPIADLAPRERAPPLRGEIPSVARRPSGCEFHPRCPQSAPRCRVEPPPSVRVEGGSVACHYPLQ